MKKGLLFILVSSLLVMSSSVFAQQFPDSGFEDWSGATFDGNIQPKYWNFSNVEQLGVKKNFAHRDNGRSGYCLKIQDQFVGVMSIGATSPGYVALGTPWAYVSSLSSIDDATAGTYGGISWSYRPDSISVWVKRVYDSSVDQAAGDHTSDENFNIVYYAWTGTSKGASYKAKDGSCNTSVVKAKPQYAVDEESDIRIALDENECGTETPGTQIAEGWYREKAKYNAWTKITVPIYYLSDNAPAKCNMILSAGNYPNYRANSGLYAGNTLYVDDISLIYSSKIQKLFINGREWKGFDPDNTTGEQTYSLGQGATVVPDIYAVRGAGSLANNRGRTATFSGRRLSNTECVITKGTVDGAVTTIQVTSEDGSSTTTYRIKFVSQASDNARLSDIRVNGTTISGFNAYLTNYNVALPYGTTTVPVVAADPQDAGATISITQPTSVNGTATILVTAQDGTHTQTYTLNFSVAQLSDNTLQDILVDGNSLPGFVPSKANYSVSLPLGTTTAPTITPVSAYPNGAQSITILKNNLSEGCQIQVSAPGAASPKTYKITYKIEASSYSYLADIKFDGVSLPSFEPTITSYSYSLPLGTTSLPAITWTPGDPYQMVTMTEGGVDGVTKIVVTAAAGNTTTYRLSFSTAKSSVDTLSMIKIDGVDLPGFSADSLNYDIVLPAGTSALPVVTWTEGDAYQTITSNVNSSLMMVRITVKAGDGTQRIYTLSFSVEKSANALLQMIYLDGVELTDFASETLDYSVALATEVIPTITVLGSDGQSITISAPAGFGTARIVVTPEEGSANVYSIVFRSASEPSLPTFPTDSIKKSNSALLENIYVGGTALAGFSATTYSYTQPLAQGSTMVPAVYPVPATLGQNITVYQSLPDRITRIHVVAADGFTSQDYTINFPLTRSSNAELQSIEIDGVDFTYVPATGTYNIVLPYGTTSVPAISYEKAENTQRVVLTQAPLSRPSTLVVTAENGTTKTYTINFIVAQSTAPNVLQNVAIDGYGLFDLTSASGTNFTIDLPYGKNAVNIVSFTKNFNEQTVVVEQGIAGTNTTVTVYPNRGTEIAKVYTFTPNMAAKVDGASLSSIKVNGTQIAGFDPQRTSYIVSVTSKPTITYTGATSSTQVYVTVDDAKHWVCEVEDGTDYKTYTIWYYYASDVIPNSDFTEWTAATKRTSAQKPTGWHVAADYADTYAWTAKTGSEVTKNGTSVAYFSTTNWAALASAIPAIATLGDLTFSFGVAGNTSSNFSGGIQFRNTPDSARINYKYQSKAGNGALFAIRFFDSDDAELTFDYTTTSTSSSYVTYAQPISLGSTVPAKMNIAINATNQTKGASSGASLYVDYINFVYNSKLTAMTVDGNAATLSGTSFTYALTDAEYAGTPTLNVTGAVEDQAQQITWNAWSGTTRTAQIRNFAEDGSYTDYTLTITRPQSTIDTVSYELVENSLTVRPGSAFQTYTVTRNATSYTIDVTAESGVTRQYVVAMQSGGPVAADVVTVSEAEEALTGSSTGRMDQVLIDETLISGFTAGNTTYSLAQDGILTYALEYAHDSVVFNINDSIYRLKVVGASANTEYTIRRSPSNNSQLADIKINGETITGFYSETYNYNLNLSSLTSVTATVQDPTAEAQTVIIKQDDTHYAIFVYVTAQDGSSTVYGIEATVRTLRTTAFLHSILADGVTITGFAQNTFNYTINLPSGSAIPTLSAVALDGASVEAATVTSGSSAVVTFHVTAENGVATNDYVVSVNVLPSDEKTLSMIYLDGAELTDFASATETYNVELPYGTTALPDVDYVKSDKSETVVVTPDGLSKIDIVVTAENGDTKTYTINFTIAKSNNAYLKSLATDGLEAFDKEDDTYDVVLPFGTTELPTITYATEESVATAVIELDGLNKATITVTAEDGVTTKTYTINFTIALSTNADLKMIFLDGDSLIGFASTTFEYADTLAFGTTELPTITWTTSDEQQVVTMEANEEKTLATISVTAGDGTTTNEYLISFFYELSSNNYLADLQINGTTIEGFDKDSIEYTITYPVGTPTANLVTKDAVVATPEDGDATVMISDEDNHTITIMVTAPNGDVRVYVIRQSILLASEARLSMILLDSVELVGFDPDVFDYTIVLTPGANMPEVVAYAMDSLADVEYGSFEDVETDEYTGKKIEIDGVAQDGSRLTYSVLFRYANWSATAMVDKDDYLFYHVEGTDQYMAVSISIGVQCAIYDMSGHRLLLGDVPVADPAYVEVEIDEYGNQILRKVHDGAEGLVFEVPNFNEPYFYVFFNSKTKKIAKGGKFMLTK